VGWAGGNLSAYLTPGKREPPDWFGSLIGGSRDQSGLRYMRNRYYDPATGQFTQQDPIGIAGGLNLYGFAGGDPVNFSDPFGQCPDGSGADGKQTTDVADCPNSNLGNAWRALDGAANGVGTTLIANIVSAGLTVNETAWSGKNNCGTTSCISGDKQTITLNSTKQPGTLAAAIGHEYAHFTETFVATQQGIGRNELRAWDATLGVAQNLQQPFASQAFSVFSTTFAVIQAGPAARAAAVKQWGCNAATKAGLPCTP